MLSEQVMALDEKGIFPYQAETEEAFVSRGQDLLRPVENIEELASWWVEGAWGGDVVDVARGAKGLGARVDPLEPLADGVHGYTLARSSVITSSGTMASASA